LYIRGSRVALDSGETTKTFSDAIPILVGGKLIFLSRSEMTVAESTVDGVKSLGSVKVDAINFLSLIFSDGRILFRTKNNETTRRSEYFLSCWDVRK